MEREILELFGKIKKCEIVQYPVVNGVMIICADSKLPKLAYELTKIGIVPIQLFGGAHPIAANVKSAVENVVDQIEFFCSLYPGREIAYFSTHDLCIYPERKNLQIIKPRETLATAIDIVQDKISHLVRQINGIHFSFQNDTGYSLDPPKIIPKLEITKKF